MRVLLQILDGSPDPWHRDIVPPSNRCQNVEFRKIHERQQHHRILVRYGDDRRVPTPPDGPPVNPRWRHVQVVGRFRNRVGGALTRVVGRRFSPPGWSGSDQDLDASVLLPRTPTTRGTDSGHSTLTKSRAGSDHSTRTTSRASAGESKISRRRAQRYSKTRRRSGATRKRFTRRPPGTV